VKPNSQVANQLTIQPTNQPTKQSIIQPNNQPTNQSSNQPSNQLNNLFTSTLYTHISGKKRTSLNSQKAKQTSPIAAIRQELTL
jgi:hypothetical protein